MAPTLTTEEKGKALTTLLGVGLTLAAMTVSGGASAYLTGAAMLVKAVGEMAAVMAHQNPAVDGVKADMQEKVGPQGKDKPGHGFHS